MAEKKKVLTTAQSEKLMELLEHRFEKNKKRHPKVSWADVEMRLKKAGGKLYTIFRMEETGGEPDVIAQESSGAVVFCDCSAETPAGRRSLCYDLAAWQSRKENKPKSSAMEHAADLGVEMLDEEQYQKLQKVAGPVDLKTSSWLATPDEIRNLGGAIFGDCRFGRVFVYHNGAESYYAARGFRGLVKV